VRTFGKTSRAAVSGSAWCLSALLSACGGGDGTGAAGSGASTGSGGSVAVAVVNGSQRVASMAPAELGVGASLGGAVPFPPDSPWNTDISAAAVDPDSDVLIASIGSALPLHPDFGSSYIGGARPGIPYLVVAAGQAKVPVTFGRHAAESDPGPYPLPPDAPIEGQPAGNGAFGGDRHVIVVDRDGNRLYELLGARFSADRGWTADAGAVFRLDSNNARPSARPGWISADSARLPVFPGLVRYDEAATGRIRHALRFTVSRTRRAYVPPANHASSLSNDSNLPPMGMHVRLKASFVIPATYSVETQAILKALKTYGMFVADTGTGWSISGAPDPRWDDDALVSQLANVIGADFEVLKMDGLTEVP
jgi:hypothetical protein